MKIGLHITKFDWPGSVPAIGPTLATIARTVNQTGFHSLWMMDSFNP